jgi:hypothetical protein
VRFGHVGWFARTGDFVDDYAAQRGVGDEEERDEPSCVVWVGGEVARAT